MAEYVCPDEIVRLHDLDPARGRAAAIEWLDGLSLKDHDRVWMPEVGWREKTGPEDWEPAGAMCESGPD